jgi:hypothetical protein
LPFFTIRGDKTILWILSMVGAGLNTLQACEESYLIQAMNILYCCGMPAFGTHMGN